MTKFVTIGGVAKLGTYRIGEDGKPVFRPNNRGLKLLWNMDPNASLRIVDDKDSGYCERCPAGFLVKYAGSDYARQRLGYGNKGKGAMRGAGINGNGTQLAPQQDSH